MKRAMWAGVALAVGLGWGVPAAGAQGGPTEIPSSRQGCQDLFNEGTNQGDLKLTKELTSVVFDEIAGTALVVFKLTTARDPEDVTRVRDCAFIDLNGNGTPDDNEDLLSFDLKLDTFENGAEYLIRLNVDEVVRICDRAAISGTDTVAGALGLPVDVDFTDKSTNPEGGKYTCTNPDGTPIPAGAIGGLGLAGLLGIALVGTQVRRNRAARRGSQAVA